MEKEKLGKGNNTHIAFFLVSLYVQNKRLHWLIARTQKGVMNCLGLFN
jgi:hypothetical protein